MLKYLIIPLATDSVSFCHYGSQAARQEWMDEDLLRQAMFWAMKENVAVQFVYPKRPVPGQIAELVDAIDYTAIVPHDVASTELLKSADIVISEGLPEEDGLQHISYKSLVVRLELAEFLREHERVGQLLPRVTRLNVVITDAERFEDDQTNEYSQALDCLVPKIVDEYKNGHQVQFNLLADRLMLKEMNNCNAGIESLTLAPDGKFYICPAFYHEGMTAVGDLETGPQIKNPQLYGLDHAPICRICDAWHCKRCVWLNKKLTREVNTPSHQQCLMAHIEREAARKLLGEFRKVNKEFLPEANIPQIDYLDPFDKLINK